MRPHEIDLYLIAMYETGPEATSVARLVQHFKEDAEAVVTPEQVAKGCERLCAKGILRRTDRGNPDVSKHRYIARDAWVNQREREFRKRVAMLFAEHEINRIKKK